MTRLFDRGDGAATTIALTVALLVLHPEFARAACATVLA